MTLPSEPLGVSRAGWEEVCAAEGFPRYRGRQIFDALHRRGTRAWSRVSELPEPLRERLDRESPIRLPEIARREDSADGSRKYGLRLTDGAVVEAVYMPGEASRSEVNEFADARANTSEGPLGSRAANRSRPAPRSEKYTVCLSSQTGCAVDCAFCVTGRLGGGRNLSSAEIVGELYAVMDDAGLGSDGLRIVFMGMGEPFLNPDGVLGALEVFLEVVSPRRITVSTSGITPAFSRFASLPRPPNLAVSINAADEETRTRLMPITRTFPLAGVVEAMRRWPADTRRPITAEYVLIAGVNDAEDDARRVVRLLSGMPVKVNLIPLNEDPIYLPGWKRPEESSVDAFARVLAKAGLVVTVRRSRGPDARAACGQLKGRLADPRRRSRAGSGTR